MRRFIQSALLLFLLNSCSQIELPALGMAPLPPSARPMLDFYVDYEVVTAVSLSDDGRDYAAAAFWDERSRLCRIQITESALQQDARLAVLYLAHEFGHCLDHAALDYSHNGFTNEGCVYGAYFCQPKEGYAETFARTYVERCGNRLEPLGVPDINDGQCELPGAVTIHPGDAWKYAGNR